MNQQNLIPTYNRQPIAFTHGDGAWLTGDDDRQYLDALGGIAVSVLGHRHPRLVAALQAQADAVLHTSNLYRIPDQEALATTLCQRANMDAAFFGNSGSEANEAAIKLARLHGRNHGITTPKIVVMEGAFHGRTLAALAATANPAAQQGFEPLPEGFIRVPYGDADAVATLTDDAIAAVLVEPIQGESGVQTPPAGYLQRLRAICDERNWLLMLDEVQCGMARTGTWFTHQHEGIRPDVMSLAKGMAGGVPMGAALVAGAATDLFGPGNHGSTFGGNPLASNAGLAVAQTIDEEQLAAHAANMGARMQAVFERRLGGCSAVRERRGAGLMIGIELDRPAAELVARGREAGVLINVTAERVVRLLPPLVITSGDADWLAETVSDLILDFVSE